jgi:hypothetical protein
MGDFSMNTHWKRAFGATILSLPALSFALAHEHGGGMAQAGAQQGGCPMMGGQMMGGQGGGGGHGMHHGQGAQGGGQGGGQMMGGGGMCGQMMQHGTQQMQGGGQSGQMGMHRGMHHGGMGHGGGTGMGMQQGMGDGSGMGMGPRPGMGMGMGMGPGMGMGRGMGMGMDETGTGAAGRVRSMVESRLAYLRSELDITEAQAAAWDRFAAAVRQRGETLESTRTALVEAMKSQPGPQRLDARIKHVEAVLESLKAQKSAAEELYAVLSAEQKKQADDLLGAGCCTM